MSAKYIKGYKFIFAVLLLTLPVLLLSQEEVIQQSGMGSINWTTGIVKAKGAGAPPPGNVPIARKRLEAIRAAKLDALRNLTELIYGVNLTSETKVENYVLTSDVIYTKVKGFLQGVEYGEPVYYEDGSVEVEARVNLKGEFASIVLPEKEFSKPPAPVRVEQPTRERDYTTENFDYRKNYTGLLVDARNLMVKPAMVPKILDEAGNIVYGPSEISREYAVQVGVVGYTKDLEKAREDERVSPTPLVVSAIRTTGKYQTDVVVSNRDARRIKAANASGNFLEKCKVMFIVK